MVSMAEKLGLGEEIRELKLGASFTNPRSTAFHTVRYDFKPASVDVNKSASIDVGTNNQVIVNVPHLDGAGTSQTVFKGSQKPYQKECVLIINKVTGEITLEKLTSNIQVKKTRSESNHKPIIPDKVPANEPLISPKIHPKMNTKQPRKERHLPPIAMNNKKSPVQASPAHTSPARSRPSPKREQLPTKSPSASPMGQSTLASLPMIGLDDYQPIVVPKLPPPSPPTVPMNSTYTKVPAASGVTLSESSSSSTSSSDDSGSDAESDESNKTPKAVVPKKVMSDSSESDSDEGPSEPPPPVNNFLMASTIPDHLLTEDLCLSESGSDSD